MNTERTTELSGRDIIVKQLTVKQVRSIFDFENHTPTEDELLIEDMLQVDIPFMAINLATGVSAEELLDISQRELDEFAEVVRQVNPGLARLIEKRLSRVRQVEKLISATETSTGQPAH